MFTYRIEQLWNVVRKMFVKSKMNKKWLFLSALSAVERVYPKKTLFFPDPMRGVLREIDLSHHRIISIT